MKTIKSLLMVAVVLCIAALAAPAAVYAETDMTVIYAQVPEGWEAPHAWAWGPRGNAFDAWPGEAMTADENNPGWYFIHIPADKEGALINANDGSVQTSDFEMTGAPVWVTIAADGEFEVTTDQQTEGDLPDAPTGVIGIEPIAADLGDMEVIVIYAHVPADWHNPGFWAWGPRGDAFPAWPGGVMSADANNPGWYYIHVPADKTGGLVNANEGSVQTTDFELTGHSVWVTIDEDGEFEVTTDQQTQGDLPVFTGVVEAAPAEDVPTVELPDVGYITLRAYVPAVWTDAGVWAWNDADGYGNVFGGWPGDRFETRDGHWYTMQLPGWVDHIIINAIAGGVQTVDIEVEQHRDIYIAILDADGAFHLSYYYFDPHEIDAPSEAPLPDLPTPVTIAADPPAQAATPPAPVVEDSGVNVVLIVVIVVVVVVVVAAAAVIILKKKK